MDTLAEAIAKTEREHAEKIEKTKQEYAARKALAAVVKYAEAGYAEPRIYVSPLYGRVGSIKFAHDRYRLSGDTTRQPDRALFWLLSDALPAQPLTKFKDGCSLSFRSTAYVDAMPDEKLKRVDLTPVAPWLLEADPNHFSETVTVSWLAVLAGQVWEIEIEYARHVCQIGSWDLVVKRTKHGEIDHVVRCDLRPTFPEAPEPPQVVRWSSGGHTSLNKFTLWWYDSEPEVLEHIRKGIGAALPEVKPA